VWGNRDELSSARQCHGSKKPPSIAGMGKWTLTGATPARVQTDGRDFRMFRIGKISLSPADNLPLDGDHLVRAEEL
jgi:hypothetical protein